MPTSLPAPLMLRLSDPSLCLPPPPPVHCLLAKRLVWKITSTLCTWSPSSSHIRNAGSSCRCPSDETDALARVHLVSPPLAPALPVAAGIEANARPVVTVPKGVLRTSQVSDSPGLHYRPALTLKSVFCCCFLFLKDTVAAGCREGVTRKILGSKCQTWALPWCLPSDVHPAPHLTQTRRSLPFLFQRGSWCLSGAILWCRHIYWILLIEGAPPPWSHTPLLMFLWYIPHRDTASAVRRMLLAGDLHCLSPWQV